MAQTGPCVVVDRTHLGRRATGIERLTRDLFSDESLSPLPVRGTAAGGSRLATLVRQLVANPLDALSHPASVWVFPGFPPSPAFGHLARRSVLYVHDLFLVERPGDLNRSARLYLAPSFRAALKSFRWFLANSETTAARLRPHVAPDATVRLYRPPARDVLGVGALSGAPPRTGADPIRIGMIGTIEPRKNYAAAVDIMQALGSRLRREVELHVVGRTGWGPDAERLARTPGVHLHGFVDDRAVVDLVRGWTLLLCTSHDEGLGLPLLEVQHAGLPVAAPDAPVFHEVLAQSGTFIDPARPSAAAAALAALIGRDGAEARTAARANIERWNRLAAADHAGVVALLADRLAALKGGTAP